MKQMSAERFQANRDLCCGLGKHRFLGGLIEDAMRSLQRESWLPLGLRSLLAHELADLRRGLANGVCDDGPFLDLGVSSLAAACASYGKAAADSETARRIRKLVEALAQVGEEEAALADGSPTLDGDDFVADSTMVSFQR